MKEKPIEEKEQAEVVSFEKAFEELEGIVDKFEKGELKLDESLELFEQGTKLLGLCEKKLNEAEVRLAKLMQDLNPIAESPGTTNQT